MCLHSHLLSYNLKVAINLMHDQHFTYLISFWGVILAPLSLCVTFSVFLLLFLNVFFSSVSCSYDYLLIGYNMLPIHPPFPPACAHGWKVISVLDWRMMLLLRESVHQHWGRRAQGDREKLWRRSGSLGRCSCDGWAVKRPIVQITQQAPCHHPGLIYGAARHGTYIAFWVYGREKERKKV